MAQSPEEPRRVANRLLDTGAKVPQVEQELVRRGLTPTAAAVVVDEVLQGKIAASAPTAARSFSWFRVVLGLVVAGAAFVGIYVCLVNAPDGVLAGAGAVRGALRGAIIGAGAGLALGALNVVR